MSFGSTVNIGRPITTQTTSALNLRTSAPKAVYPSARQVTSQKCCETGRPVMVDPVTGVTVCSCQLKANMPAYLSRVPSLPETMYSGACHQFPTGTLSPESQAAFFQMGMKAAGPGDSLKVAPSVVHAPYYLDHLMSSHPYNAFYSGFDFNGARRKNATRETTSALKAWLYEHRKNPYPTKGEKIMLAIITRMTLTQVSTWFANARRRLKKESKMDDNDLDDIDVDDISDKSTGARLSESDDGGSVNVTTELSDISDVDEPTTRVFPVQSRSKEHFSATNQSAECSSVSPQPNFTLTSTTGNKCAIKISSTISSDSDASTDKIENFEAACDRVDNVKPKIWSITEIISPKQSTDKNTVQK